MKEYAFSSQANYRKGGLLCLAAAAVALAEQNKVSHTVRSNPCELIYLALFAHKGVLHGASAYCAMAVRAWFLHQRADWTRTCCTASLRTCTLRLLQWADPSCLQVEMMQQYLGSVVPPVLHSLVDPDARVRYYACEALYNIAKVAREDFMPHFLDTFEALFRLCADSDQAVHQATSFLDNLLKVHGAAWPSSGTPLADCIGPAQLSWSSPAQMAAPAVPVFKSAQCSV